MPKRKTKDEKVEEEEHEDEEDLPKKRSKPKKTKEVEPFEEDGWTNDPGRLICYKSWGGSKPSSKIAAFDLDGTLAVNKSSAKWPKDANDFKLYNKEVPSVLKEFHDEGYRIVIFSNQGSIKTKLSGPAAAKVKGRVQNIVQELGVPALALLATSVDDDQEYRKPNPGMWEFYCQHLAGGQKPDMASSFFVGDAAGREGDFADSDKKFAQAAGLTFKVPEDVLGPIGHKKDLSNAPAGAGGEHNAELADIFNQLADKAFASGEDKQKFRGAAFRKVAATLRNFPKTVDASTLKEFGGLKGIGKATIGVVKEWLDTGKVAELEEEGGGGAAGAAPKETAKGAGKKAAKPSDAMKFM